MGASAEDDINLKKLKYMDVPILILLFRYAPSASEDFCRASATVRARPSTLPPGENGTTSLIFLVASGEASCANPHIGTSSEAARSSPPAPSRTVRNDEGWCVLWWWLSMSLFSVSGQVNLRA